MDKQSAESQTKMAWWHWLLLLVLVTSAVSLLFVSETEQPAASTEFQLPRPIEPPSQPVGNGGIVTASTADLGLPPRTFDVEKVTLWWEGLPESLTSQDESSVPLQNIHPGDYTGPEVCRKCHKKNYEGWYEHTHRRMNALANESTVIGDFSGQSTIEYLGGVGTFFREDNDYRMRLERGDVTLVYDVNQTIGSRFFQYYVGRLLQSTRPLAAIYSEQDQVLPFGYWLDEKQWVPVVHVYDEVPDSERFDPFALAVDPLVGRDIYLYALNCNHCHTTFPLGDMLIKFPNVVARFPPMQLHMSAYEYLSQEHAEMLPPDRAARDYRNEEISQVLDSVVSLQAPEHAVTLGISCEACHLGCREHAEGQLEKPEFTPLSPHLRRGEQGEAGHWDREVGAKWTCGRCHTGDRPRYANGISTWNSTDYEDAMRGSCYSELTCVHCHNPHEAIGPQWTRTPGQDDERCLSCHGKFTQEEARLAHTHHSADSAGSRCMNCHMPRINEGLQDVVRTHTIFSPTQSNMIHANQPNACNLCHVDKPIDWTIEYLGKWYGAKFSDQAIAKNYPHRDGPVGIGWLKHKYEPVRLVASHALTDAAAQWALSELIDALDDPYLLNRQFALIGLEEMLDRKLAEFGYRFYMTKQERQAPLDAMRAELLRGRSLRERALSPQAN